MPILWLAGQAAVFIVFGLILGRWARRDWQVCAGVGLIAAGCIIAALALLFLSLELLIKLFA